MNGTAKGIASTTVTRLAASFSISCVPSSLSERLDPGQPGTVESARAVFER